MSAVTRKVSEDLARMLGERKYDMWFGPSTRFRIDGQRLEVITPSPYVTTWIDAQFSGQLRDAARKAMGQAATVVIRTDPAADQKPKPGPTRRRKRAPADSLDTVGDGATIKRRRDTPTRDFVTPLRYRLETLVVGESNKLAHRAAMHLAQSPDDGGLGPVFLYGECGLGKTHILQGTCRLFLENAPNANVRYTTGEQFTNEFIHAIQKGSIDAFRRQARTLDLLAIDDVHFLSNKSSTQSEFLHTLDTIRMCGARIIMASDEHPRHLRQINQALVSRFLAGIVARLDRPSRDMRIELVRRFAAQRNMRINDRAVEMIASNCLGSVREIEGAVMKLDALRSMAPPRNGESTDEIGCVLVESLFKSEAVTTKPIRIESILDHVCARLAVEKGDLLSSTRHRRVVLARGLISHLARELTTMSYPEIGRAIGRRNHSTVLTAARRIERQIADGETVDSGDGQPLALRDLTDELRLEIRRHNRS